MGAMVKYLAASYPPQELVFFRNIFGVIPNLLILVTSRDWHESGRPLAMKQWRLGIFRGLMVVVAQTCFYISLVHLELATASVLAFTTPLFVTALSVPLLGDRVGAWRWTAVLIGFAGVVLVMQPGSDVFSPWALLPLGAGFGYACTTVSVRLITEKISSATINLYSLIGAISGSFVLMTATSGYMPVASAEHWFLIIAMAMIGGTGVFCIVTAYRMTKPSNLAPFEYLGIVHAFVLGWIFFAEAPLERLFPGVILIIGAGLLIIWRERRRTSR
jgi:drug/metabolite transporter (DMT)-like permease